MNNLNSIALKEIYKYHNEWINTTKTLYGNNVRVKNYSEDFVQEVYMKLAKIKNLHEKVIKPDGTLSKGYVFFCLRSIVLNDLKKKKVINYTHVGDLFDIEDKIESTGVKAKHLREREAIRFISNVIDDGRDETRVKRELIEDKLLKMLETRCELVNEYSRTDKSYRDMCGENGFSTQIIYSRMKSFKKDVESELGQEYITNFNIKK
jgi:hypothetical protein